MKKVLSDIVTLLEVNDKKISSYELADMLWLGAIMDEHNHSVTTEDKNEQEQNLKPKNSETSTKTEDNNVDASKDEVKDSYTSKYSSSNPLYMDGKEGEDSKKGEYKKIPTPRQYTQYNQFANVLKILRQQSVSNTEKVLDEESTVEYIANTHVWDVVTKPKREKKFTLNIIIEKSESMEVWEEMTKDFTSVVASFLFFKELNVYYLKESEKEFALYRDKKCQSKISVNILHSLEHRNLTMLMSDCISLSWGDERGYKFLKDITKITPFMILNMLPQRVWKRTILDNTWRIKFTHKEGWFNKHLISDIDEQKCKVSKKHIKVPMTTFDTISLKHWSNLIAGEKENWLYGSLFESECFDNAPKVKDDSQEDEDPIHLVKDFEIFASPMAQKLAIYFSVIPLSLDIMKIVQKVSLPESNYTHLAEVFLSGLLKTTLLRTPSGKMIYEFVDGVRSILKDKLYQHKKEDILKANTSFIAKAFDSTTNFHALMENPNSEGDIPLSSIDKMFAEIIVDVFGKVDEGHADKLDTLKTPVKNDTENIITPLKIFTGQPAHTQDIFFSRDAIVNEIWRNLDNGNNILLEAPKKFGKTSILKYIEQNPKDYYIVHYLDTLGISNEDEFFTKLYKVLINILRNTDISSIVPHLDKYNGSVFSDVETIIENMSFNNKTIVIVIDELSEVIQKYDKKEVGIFLKKLRSLRMISTNIKFIFSDSQYSLYYYSWLINDLHIINIPLLNDDGIKEYQKFQAKLKSDRKLTLNYFKENLYDDIYEKLSNSIKEEFKDYDVDSDYLPEDIDEVRITEIYIPEELEFNKIVKYNDTYILDISFETEASVWMLVDRNYYDYISLKLLPIRDYNKQYYNAESEETLFIEMSIEFKIDKNEKIVDLFIAVIDDVVLLEDEHPDKREQDIKNQISDEITSKLETEHLKELDNFQFYDESLPSDDHSARISSYDLPKEVEIENIEIVSNQFYAKIYLEQEVYLDINIFKNDYYTDDEYGSLYGAIEQLNKYYVTVEGHALISIELYIQGRRDKDIDSVDALDIDIVDVSVIEQIPMGNNIDFDQKFDTFNRIKEEYGDIAWEQKSFLHVETKDGNIKHLDVDDKQEKEKQLNKNRYLLCEIINLNTLYMLKIKLNKNDKQRIFKGQLTIDIRDYYEIYNDLKSQTNDKLIKKLERKCWKIDLKIIENNIGDSNIMYLSKNIFEYTPKPSILDTISPTEKKLIQLMRDYDRFIYLTDFTQSLSQKLKISRNKVIKILYRWRVFEKIDLAKESCISDLEINRNALVYILSLEI